MRRRDLLIAAAAGAATIAAPRIGRAERISVPIRLNRWFLRVVDMITSKFLADNYQLS